jgi:cyclopropane fatty-acyl-phospholipid synthase-like methyltransferase
VQLHTCEHCEALKPPAAGRVLELGCGTGASAVWMAAQVNCAKDKHTSSTPAIKPHSAAACCGTPAPPANKCCRSPAVHTLARCAKA